MGREGTHRATVRHHQDLLFQPHLKQNKIYRNISYLNIALLVNPLSGKRVCRKNYEKLLCGREVSTQSSGSEPPKEAVGIGNGAGENNININCAH